MHALRFASRSAVEATALRPHAIGHRSRRFETGSLEANDDRHGSIDEDALASRDAFRQKLREAGYDDIAAEIAGPSTTPTAPAFDDAGDRRRQSLAKNPMGYCGLDGTGTAGMSPGKYWHQYWNSLLLLGSYAEWKPVKPQPSARGSNGGRQAPWWISTGSPLDMP